MKRARTDIVANIKMIFVKRLACKKIHIGKRLVRLKAPMIKTLQVKIHLKTVTTI